MTVKSIKTEIYKLIDDIEDKKILSLLKEEIQTYTTFSQTDILDDLTEAQLQQLQVSIDEVEKKEVISLKGFKKLTARWRTK
ncbi:MAG: hypothetical protein ABIN89_05870 [Chitinophagaceae bacterium]